MVDVAASALYADPLAARAKRLHQQEISLRSQSPRIAEVLQSVDPAKKKLNSVESQRIMAVLDEGIRRVELVTALPFVTKSLSRFAVALGSELTATLEEHRHLEVEYERLLGHSQSRPMLVRKGTSTLIDRKESHLGKTLILGHMRRQTLAVM
jgi:hypothetical protein